MFTLKTLLGCVYVQLLTYEDVTVCISLTWSSRMHTNVQLKTRSHICVHVFFLRRRIYIPLLLYETHVCIPYFLITLTEKNVSTQLLTYKAAFLKNSLSWPTCLHASSSTKNDWLWRRLTTTTKKNERPPWLTTTIKKTDHEERLTTTTDHDMTLHHFDLWKRLRVQLLTYVLMSGWKVSIVLLSANTLCVMFAVKKMCLYASFDTRVHDYVQFRA